MSQRSGSTTASGAPAESDRNSLSIGTDGPLLLHDVHLVETLAHFNRERVPERDPHAKGSGAFGVFVTTADVGSYTKAALFQKGAKTKMLARFSTVAGEQGSPDTWRDVRGFALKFYTSDGNYDLVGNNTPVFFLRDPMKFPQVFSANERNELVETVAGALSGVTGEVLDRAFLYWRNVDADVGARIERKVRSGAAQEGVEGMGGSADASLHRAM